MAPFIKRRPEERRATLRGKMISDLYMQKRIDGDKTENRTIELVIDWR